MNRQVSASSAPAAVSSRRIAVVLLALAVSSFSSAGTTQTNAGPTRAPKNVVLMISDGTGVNTIAAAGMYSGKFGKQIFDGSGWIKTFASTYPLRTSDSPIPGAAGLQQDPDALYDPAKNWDTTPANTSTGRYPDHFAGYRWTKTTAPDSANTLVAVVSGHKTYNAAVNVDGSGKRLITFAELEHQAGKSIGVVTTVQISDATPAVAGGAHNVSRANRTAIASEMLNAGTLSVIMGTGNPDYTDNGMRRNAPDYSWISANDWADLKAGKTGFKLIQDKSDFDVLSTARTTPAKLIGVAHSFDSTQFNRAGAAPANETPYQVARKSDVPSLKTMMLGALNVLGRDPDGLFLMIEGGAVDRAMHANNLGRMIEEKIEFDEAVEAVSAYLDANTNGNNWFNTLVLVTGDHDHLLLGPDSDTVPFQNLVDKGAGRLPGYKWQHNGHSNQLVPLYARGLGADRFLACAKRRDLFTDRDGRTFGRGAYLDQTDIFTVMSGRPCS
jgi:alkaline phosphatase